ncbi:MAG: pyruvate dehydrogenase (acetyl-transferring), homodimeric type, partial [Microlunatus sp.]|nr:pyruvate dehydrogenase (acetyl-transferring), homodimeric type [Microlunatus sp.]
INEAGSFAAFTAVRTSYATQSEPMIPVYLFYSMFGLQRTGDAMWAAMDQMARGFIIAATAGRTTLTGEGLQHADGHSPLLASTNPGMKVYDPAYGYEIAYIVEAGLEQMYGPDSTDRNWMYYLTVYNEPMLHPAEPDDVDAEGIVKGIHRLHSGGDSGPKVQLLGSGVSVPWALEAASILESEWGVSADVWSVTSWVELRRDGLDAEKHNFLYPDEQAQVPYVTRKLADAEGPIIASTDYMSAVPDQIRQFLPNAFATLGADDHGFSDTRAAARRFFHIDVHSMVVRALQELAAAGDVPSSAPKEAAEKYQLLDVTSGTTGNVGGDA